MRLKTLGSLVLEEGGFTRSKPLLLLCYLALEGSRERRYLAELFWMGAKDPLNSLSKAIYRLRQMSETVLFADEKVVRTEVETDARRFLEYVRAGDHAAALELYQGTFLQGVQLQNPGIELEEWVYSTRELFAGYARKAMLHLAESDAAAGDFAEALKRTEAAYKLNAAPDLEPAELTRLYTLLRSGDSPLAASLSQEAQTYGLTLSQTVEEAQRKLRNLQSTPHNLPKQPTSFVGRELELAEITRLFDDEDRRLVTLLGYGGAGKSRMALQVAWRLLEQDKFENGVYFVALDALTNPSAIPIKVMEALEIEIAGGGAEEPLAYLGEHLQDKQMLLVLDNYEHLIEAATLTTELLAACPNLKLLVTSRERLNVSEEWVAPLTGLTFPPEVGLELEAVPSYDAVRLFLQRAERAHPSFVPSDEDLAAIAGICQLVEGSPLAIELAAAWVRGLKLADIAAELRRNFSLLETATRDVQDRHRSIHAAFEHSWQLLSIQEQKTYRQFAVFRGGFTKEAAQAVADASPTTLLRLVDKSLLRLSETGRYDRHPLLYEYSWQKLSKYPEEVKQAKDRHASYYAKFMVHRLEEEYGPDHKIIIDALEQELPNVRAAWPHILDKQDYEQLTQVRKGLFRYHRYRGNPQETVAMLYEALPLLEKHEKAREALGGILGLLAILHQQLGQLEQCKTVVEQSVEVLKHSDDLKVKTSLSSRRASLNLRLGEYKEAVKYYGEALEASKRSGNRVDEGISLANLGVSYRGLGNYELAEKYTLDSIALDRDLDNLEGTGSDLVILANLYLATDRLEEAERAFEEALELGQKIGFQHLIAQSLTGLGECAFKARHYTKAEALYREAQEVLLKASDFGQGIEVEYGLARVERVLGRYDAAHQRLHHALTKATKSGLISSILEGLFGFAEHYSETGHRDLSWVALTYLSEHPNVSAPALARVQKHRISVRESLSSQEANKLRSSDEQLTLEDVVKKMLEASPEVRV